jgi:RNA polymerase primary sigma factor
MYLREMGAVELLSREGEIAIAKRIEAGRDTMIMGLCESPITFHAIIQWSEALNNGEMQLREILDLDAMLSKEPPSTRWRKAPRTTTTTRDLRSHRRPDHPSEDDEPEEEEEADEEDEDGEPRAPRARKRRRTTPSPSPRWKPR